MPFEHARLPELQGEHKRISLGRFRRGFLYRGVTRHMNSLEEGEYDSSRSFFCGKVEVDEGVKLAEIWQLDEQEDFAGLTHVELYALEGKKPHISATHKDRAEVVRHIELDPWHGTATDLVVGREVMTALSGLSRIRNGN